jgi:hypothetical protein
VAKGMLQAPEGQRFAGTSIVVGFSSEPSTAEESVSSYLAGLLTHTKQAVGKRRWGRSVDLLLAGLGHLCEDVMTYHVIL